jgi:hypothetical protein
VLLGLGAAIVWLQVIGAKSEAGETRCDPPAAASAEAGQPAPPTPVLGQHVSKTGLDQTAAAPPDQAVLRVLNASNQRGKAARITESLRQLGFSQVSEPKDDPVYPERDLTCRGQIRFGAQGAPVARTLSLIEPCAELIKDDRQDASADLVIGKTFDELPVRPETRQIIKTLNDWAAQHPAETGGLQSVQSGSGPQIDPALIEAVRKASCG